MKRKPKEFIEIGGVTYKAYRFRRKADSTKTDYKVKIICPICNESRLIFVHSLKKYGSAECYSCSRPKKERFEKKCLICGETFKRIKYHFKNQKYCSVKCAGKARRGISTKWENRYMGEKHWNWKGGVTGKDKYERIVFKKYYQPKVFERDDFICQLCGERGGYLHADHIKNWNKHPDLRFELDNCRTLCRSCHYLITWGKTMEKDNKWTLYSSKIEC